jgi:putative aminopeptidase FrvX
MNTAFLETLMGIPSPTGYEAAAARSWRAEAATFADRTWSDAHGNSFAAINEGGKPRVMLAGHIDEIGLLLTYVDDKGFIYFGTLGGFDPQVLPGQRVRIRTRDGSVLGVIGRKPIHLLRDAEEKKVVKIDDLWIDIGAKDKKDAEGLVEVGDAAVLDYGYAPLRNDLVVARGFDDRIGAFVVLEAARILSRRRPSCAVVAVATVQEEVGLRGAVTSAFGLEPAVGIAVDVTFGMDTPGTDEDKKHIGEIALGKGPSIMRGPNANPRLFRLMVEAAADAGIAYQVEAVPRPAGTDAAAIQISRAGVAAGLVSVPNRYMHSPCEIVHLGDVEQCANLLAETCLRIDGNTSFIQD